MAADNADRTLRTLPLTWLGEVNRRGCRLMRISQFQITAFAVCVLLFLLAAGMIHKGGYATELAVAVGAIGYVAKSAIDWRKNGHKKRQRPSPQGGVTLGRLRNLDSTGRK